MRKFVFAVILLIGVIYVITRSADLQAIVETLQRGDWRFLFLALGVQLLWLTNVAFSFKAIYRILGIKVSVLDLLPVASAANFLNIVAPSAGVSGMAMFVTEARRRNYSPGKAAVAGALFLLFDYGAFMLVLALGLVVLLRRNHLDAGELIPSAALFGFFLVLATLLYLGARSAERLGQALVWMARQVNCLARPFIKRDYLSEKRAFEFAKDAAEGILAMIRQPDKMVAPTILAISMQVLLILVLFLSFLAFQVPVSFGTLIAGFSIGYLFLIVSPTPAGLGFVEGMLALTLRSMYVPFGAAAVITITYRGFTFWVPFFMGMLSFRWLDRTGTYKKETAENS